MPTETPKDRVLAAFATALENILEAVTSKKMLGLWTTLGMIWVLRGHPEVQAILGGVGGLYQAAQGASDAWGRGKVLAEGRVARTNGQNGVSGG